MAWGNAGPDTMGAVWAQALKVNELVGRELGGDPTERIRVDFFKGG